MSKKNSKVEKETRRLMESIGDLVKKKGDGSYKFKTKNNKVIKQVKRTCVHWIPRNNKDCPTVVQDPDRPGHWKCRICQASFPIVPLKSDHPKKTQYELDAQHMLELVNQIQFWAVELGGDADDTKMFLRLKRDLPRFGKVAKHILKRVNDRNKFEDNRSRTDAMSQFDAYGINYRY